mmetsp:Transcript_95373/g.309017  ORF Transcript_95373/g.309017 Transcript_95373/m.309017 type:complete len:260 (+) Transcript_95373:480-1259(+)
MSAKGCSNALLSQASAHSIRSSPISRCRSRRSRSWLWMRSSSSSQCAAIISSRARSATSNCSFSSCCSKSVSPSCATGIFSSCPCGCGGGCSPSGLMLGQGLTLSARPPHATSQPRCACSSCATSRCSAAAALGAKSVFSCSCKGSKACRHGRREAALWSSRLRRGCWTGSNANLCNSGASSQSDSARSRKHFKSYIKSPSATGTIDALSTCALHSSSSIRSFAASSRAECSSLVFVFDFRTCSDKDSARCVISRNSSW